MTTPKKAKSTANRNKKIADMVASGIRILFAPLGSRRRETMLSVLSQKLVPTVSVPINDNQILNFWGFGGWAAYRGRSVLDKEPLTIKWIDSFEQGCVFWDIGANIGTYTVYAGVTKKTKTYAVEPSHTSVGVLTKNIELNGIDENVTVLPIALTEVSSLNYLEMIATESGNTGAQFNPSESSNSSIFKQACFGFSIDDLIAKYGCDQPNHMKIDVDGIELSILKGASKTLENRALKSIILEADINSEAYLEIKNLLDGYGFKESESEATVKGREHTRNIIFSR